MDYHGQLALHVMEGAAFKTRWTGKVFINIYEEDKLRLDYENDGEEVLTPRNVQDVIWAAIEDQQSVTVWFMPQTDRSSEVTVPVTDWTQVTTDDGAWGPNALKKAETIDKVNEIVKNTHGVYKSGP